MQPAAVILDFDGVVVDSLAAHLTAWAQAVRQVFRCDLPEPEELSGHATRTIGNILAKRYGDPSLAKTLVQTKEMLLVPSGVPLLPGARDFIAAAKALGLPLGIASNSRRPFIAALVEHYQLGIEVLVGAGEVSRGKPAPDVFLECARLLKVPRADYSRCLVFDDSAHGVKAGHAAAMHTIGICGTPGAAKASAQQAAGAAASCQDLADALARGWLQKV